MPSILNLGSVSYLNSKPLIFGLEKYDDLKLHLDVPANLLEGLHSGIIDIALLPVIDYQRLPNLLIVPSGGIGSDGETLTVRIFSPVSLEKITTLACDPDSHTSVALAQIVLKKKFNITPKLTNLTDNPAPNTARLLIGDKVVTKKPICLPHELDLGGAWKQITGLPFVFAVWTTRRGVDLRDLPTRLKIAREDGLANLSQIVETHALPMGWPRDLAMKYLTRHLDFQIGSLQIQAIKLFHEMAANLKIISNPRPLEMYE